MCECVCVCMYVRMYVGVCECVCACIQRSCITIWVATGKCQAESRNGRSVRSVSVLPCSSIVSAYKAVGEEGNTLTDFTGYPFLLLVCNATLKYTNCAHTNPSPPPSPPSITYTRIPLSS